MLKQKNRKLLGLHSVEGALNYADLIATIESEENKKLFTDLLVNWSRDLMIVHTPAEHRTVIMITEDMIVEHGITAVFNSYDIEWPAEGATTVEATPIKVGDVLVLEKTSFGEAFYVVGGDEYKLTHVDGHI